MSNVWMLFESGRAATVKLNLHAAHPETGRPIDAYLITEGRGDVTTAARRGAEAAYAWCRQGDAQLPAAVVSYDLAGLAPNDSLSGGSGGLAFAITLALQLRPASLGGDVAATGEILSGHDGGPVGPVAGIQSKLKAAAALLSPGSLLFYPGDHDNELSPQLRHELLARNLKLCPVTSVDQALGLLYADTLGSAAAVPEPTAKNSHRGRYLLLALLPLALATAWAAQHYAWLPNREVSKSPVGVAGATAELGEEVAPAETLPQPFDTAPQTPGQPNSPPESIVPAPKPEGTVTLTGNSQLASALASQLERRFVGTLPADCRLTGEVAIVAMNEQEEEGRLVSSITVTLRHTILNGPNGHRALPEQIATVRGFGPAANRLPAAARQLAGALLAPANHNRTNSGTGFD